MNFILCSDSNYFYLLKLNCQHVKRVYPEARLLIYDFGLKSVETQWLTQHHTNIIIIDWKEKLKDWRILRPTLSDEQIRSLSYKVNSRKKGIKKKVAKYIMKRFPQSRYTLQKQDAALRYEYLLMIKINCMQHASKQCPNEKMVFLDTDAILFKPFDELYKESADIYLTVLEQHEHSYQFDRCFVFNSGVLFFSHSQHTRDIFLNHWWQIALKTNEWLREQTALVRLISQQTGNHIQENKSYSITLDNTPIKVCILPCTTYNFIKIEEQQRYDIAPVKIFHFAGMGSRKAVLLDRYKKLVTIV